MLCVSVYEGKETLWAWACDALRWGRWYADVYHVGEWQADAPSGWMSDWPLPHGRQGGEYWGEERVKDF